LEYTFDDCRRFCDESRRHPQGLLLSLSEARLRRVAAQVSLTLD
jgi:hypothetical protein